MTSGGELQLTSVLDLFGDMTHGSSSPEVGEWEQGRALTRLQGSWKVLPGSIRIGVRNPPSEVQLFQKPI